MSDTPEQPKDSKENGEQHDIGVVVDQLIERELHDSYLTYAMSTIMDRALPDVRDGLKPVHRRILYAMYESGFTANRPYKKCARIVGDVLGRYHPHGDTAIYDSLVRMAQDWSLRYMMVDGQGNFGSVDGDNPAAMRYTEARMRKTAEDMLLDIDKETIERLFDDIYLFEEIATQGQENYMHYNVISNPKPFIDRFKRILH